jgi:hypothetical protein
MKIHELEAGAMHQPSRRLANGAGGWLQRATLSSRRDAVELGASGMRIYLEGSPNRAWPHWASDAVSRQRFGSWSPSGGGKDSLAPQAT